MTGQEIRCVCIGIVIGCVFAIVLHVALPCHKQEIGYNQGYHRGYMIGSGKVKHMNWNQIKALHPDLEDVVLIGED